MYILKIYMYYYYIIYVKIFENVYSICKNQFTKWVKKFNLTMKKNFQFDFL